MPIKKVNLRGKETISSFKKEFNNSINTAIIAAFGFLMALVWRDVIVEFVEKISSLSPVQGKLFSAIAVTFISVIGILVVARIFKKRE